MAIDLTKFTKGKNFLSTDFNFDDPSDKISVKTDAASSVGAAIAAAVPVGATAAETIAGTDDAKFLSPADLKAAVGSGAAYKIDVATDATIHGVTVGLGGGAVGSNTAVGNGAITASATGTANTAVGSVALSALTSGGSNSAFGYGALSLNSTAFNNTAIGAYALSINTTGVSNTALGEQSLYANVGTSYNLALGTQSLFANTASYNTACGYQTGYSNTTAAENVYVGYQSGYLTTTNGSNTYVGSQCGYNTTGGLNTFVGHQSGMNVTTGSQNTIVGRFNGNSGNLDIRTASNYIVLSDGAGNPRQVIDNNGSCWLLPSGNGPNNSLPNGGVALLGGFGASSVFVGHVSGTASGMSYGQYFYNGAVIGSITQNGTTGVSYNTASDYRLKENATPVTTGLATIAALNPVTFNWKSDGSEETGFLAHEFQAVIPRSVTGEKDAVDEEGNPVYQSMDSSGAIPFLVAAIQELSAKNDALEARLVALEAK